MNPGSTGVSIRRFTNLLIGGAVIGKLLGFLREVIMAQAIGISIVADSFRGALTAILLPLALFQGDIGPAVLIPLHRQWKAEGQAAQRFASLSALLVTFSIVPAFLVAVFADQWVKLLVGG